MSAEVPQITDVQRLHLEPGDALVVRVDASRIDMAAAASIKARVREVLRNPDIPVLVIGPGTEISTLSGAT